MKILFVYESISTRGGGSQFAVLSWIKNLNILGQKTKLLTNNGSRSKLEKYFQDKSLFNKDLSLGFLYPQYSLSFKLNDDLKKQILDFSPEIIHLNETLFLSYDLQNFAKKNNIKVTTSIHTNYKKAEVHSFPLNLLFNKNGIFNNIILSHQEKIIEKSDCIIMPTISSEKDFFNKKNEKPIFFVPYPINGYFFNHSFPKARQPKRIITITRLSGEKNVDILIEAMKYLDNYSLTVVGDGVDKKYLQNKVFKLGLSNKIKFLGWIDNKELIKTIKKHHLFASASTFETFGITYIETLACGLPNVVYDSPVTREVIPNNMAIFVNSLNPKIWARKILNIDDSQYEKLKKNIKKDYPKLRKYHEVNSTKELISVYDRILEIRQ